jgi:outer membrane protein
MLAVGASFATAQSPKIAYVNSEVILRELPEAQKARKEMEDIVKGWNSELEKMTTELQKGIEEYTQKQALYQPSKRDEEERRLANLRQQAQEYQVKKFDNQRGEIVELQEKKLGPIRERILTTIEEVAKADGFSFVFDKPGEVLLLYADSKYDITYKVLDQLKRGSGGGK